MELDSFSASAAGRRRKREEYEYDHEYEYDTSSSKEEAFHAKRARGTHQGPLDDLVQRSYEEFPIHVLKEEQRLLADHQRLYNARNYGGRLSPRQQEQFEQVCQQLGSERCNLEAEPTSREYGKLTGNLLCVRAALPWLGAPLHDPVGDGRQLTPGTLMRAWQGESDQLSHMVWDIMLGPGTEFQKVVMPIRRMKVWDGDHIKVTTIHFDPAYLSELAETVPPDRLESFTTVSITDKVLVGAHAEISIHFLTQLYGREHFQQRFEQLKNSIDLTIVHNARVQLREQALRMYTRYWSKVLSNPTTFQRGMDQLAAQFGIFNQDIDNGLANAIHELNRDHPRPDLDVVVTPIDALHPVAKDNIPSNYQLVLMERMSLANGAHLEPLQHVVRMGYFYPFCGQMGRIGDMMIYDWERDGLKSVKWLDFIHNTGIWNPKRNNFSEVDTAPLKVLQTLVDLYGRPLSSSMSGVAGARGSIPYGMLPVLAMWQSSFPPDRAPRPFPYNGGRGPTVHAFCNALGIETDVKHRIHTSGVTSKDMATVVRQCGVPRRMLASQGLFMADEPKMHPDLSPTDTQVAEFISHLTTLAQSAYDAARMLMELLGTSEVSAPQVASAQPGPALRRIAARRTALINALRANMTAFVNNGLGNLSADDIVNADGPAVFNDIIAFPDDDPPDFAEFQEIASRIPSHVVMGMALRLYAETPRRRAIGTMLLLSPIKRARAVLAALVASRGEANLSTVQQIQNWPAAGDIDRSTFHPEINGDVVLFLMDQIGLPAGFSNSGSRLFQSVRNILSADNGVEATNATERMLEQQYSNFFRPDGGGGREPRLPVNGSDMAAYNVWLVAEHVVLGLRQVAQSMREHIKSSLAVQYMMYGSTTYTDADDDKNPLLGLYHDDPGYLGDLRDTAKPSPLLFLFNFAVGLIVTAKAYQAPHARLAAALDLAHQHSLPAMQPMFMKNPRLIADVIKNNVANSLARIEIGLCENALRLVHMAHALPLVEFMIQNNLEPFIGGFAAQHNVHLETCDMLIVGSGGKSIIEHAMKPQVTHGVDDTRQIIRLTATIYFANVVDERNVLIIPNAAIRGPRRNGGTTFFDPHNHAHRNRLVRSHETSRSGGDMFAIASSPTTRYVTWVDLDPEGVANPPRTDEHSPRLAYPTQSVYAYMLNLKGQGTVDQLPMLMDAALGYPNPQSVNTLCIAGYTRHVVDGQVIDSAGYGFQQLAHPGTRQSLRNLAKTRDKLSKSTAFASSASIMM